MNIPMRCWTNRISSWQVNWKANRKNGNKYRNLSINRSGVRCEKERNPSCVLLFSWQLNRSNWCDTIKICMKPRSNLNTPKKNVSFRRRRSSGWILFKTSSRIEFNSFNMTYSNCKRKWVAWKYPRKKRSSIRSLRLCASEEFEAERASVCFRKTQSLCSTNDPKLICGPWRSTVTMKAENMRTN